MRRLLVSALASSLLSLGGCAHEAVLDEARLGRLPIEAKQDVFVAQHNVSVAEANLLSARRARDENRLFVSMAEDELAAARSRIEAARAAVELAERAGDDHAARAAARELDAAEKEHAAARVKRDYADRLTTQRDEEVELYKRQIALARADLDLVSARALRRNGMQPSSDEAALRAARDERARAADEQHRRTLAVARDSDRLRVSWEQHRHTFDVAAREVGPSSLPAAPRAPERYHPIPLPSDTRTTDDAAPPPAPRRRM